MVRYTQLRTVLVLIGCWLTVADSRSVLAWEAPIQGGAGGGPFRVHCPAGHFIVGFEGRSGAVIDHMRLICGVVEGNPQRVRRTGPVNINIGTSSGGAPAYSDCPDGWGIRSIAFENTWIDYKQNGYVHHINFECMSLAGPESIWRHYGAPGNVTPPRSTFPAMGKFLGGDSRQNCPSGELAVGFKGNAGLYVDALGLICAPVPKPAISPGINDRVTLAPGRPGGPLSTRPFADPSPPPAAPPPPLPGMQGQQPVDDQGRMAMRQTGFTGNWHTFTDKNWTYAMTLRQDGTRVNGSYVAQNGANGRITGRVRGDVLEFTWTQDGGFKGTGQFSLSPNGNSFSGVYRSDPHPSIKDPRYLQGTWNGTRR